MSLGWLLGGPRHHPTPMANAREAARREAARRANPQKYRCTHREVYRPSRPAGAKTFNTWVRLGYVVNRGEKARYHDRYGVAYFTPEQVKPRGSAVRNSSGMSPEAEIEFLNSLDAVVSPAEGAFRAWRSAVEPEIESIARAAFYAGFRAGFGVATSETERS